MRIDFFENDHFQVEILGNAIGESIDLVGRARATHHGVERVSGIAQELDIVAADLNAFAVLADGRGRLSRSNLAQRAEQDGWNDESCHGGALLRMAVGTSSEAFAAYHDGGTKDKHRRGR